MRETILCSLSHPYVFSACTETNTAFSHMVYATKKQTKKCTKIRVLPSETRMFATQRKCFVRKRNSDFVLLRKIIRWFFLHEFVCQVNYVSVKHFRLNFTFECVISMRLIFSHKSIWLAMSHLFFKVSKLTKRKKQTIID